MRTTKLRMVAVGAALAFVLTTAACSDDSDSGTPDTDAPSTDAPSTDATDGGDNGGGGDAEAGKTLFTASCSSCHGPEGLGVEGLGKDLTTSEFVKGLSNDELIAFIEVGRGAEDPANTTGVAMPPKGGNPALTSEDLANAVAFIRSIEK